MAEVWRAHDLRHGRDVALKLIREELATVIGSDRFLREITITARLTHPHIRPLLDSGEVGGRPWYAMPFVRGETLQEKLKREGALGLEESLGLGRELADALDYAHREGVIHRDVKPSNVFLEEGHAVLTDFGIAIPAGPAERERLTDSGVVIGTPEYLSPEQCSGAGVVDGRADVYSLGCVLYEMLTGEPPFTGRNRVAIIARQMHETAPSAAILRPDLPAEVDDVLRRCLAKTPADRFRSAGDLRNALDEALSAWKTGSSRGPATLPGGRRRWTPGERMAAGLVAIGLTLVGAWWMTRSRAVAADPDRVVVFPLVDRGGGADTGSRVAMMIANALEHADPLIAADGYDYLTPSQRSDPSLLSLDEARTIARARRAARFITGGVTRTPDSTSVRLILYDSRSGGETASGSYTGPNSLTPDQVGTRAMIELLPSLIDPGRPFAVSVLTERDPAAVALWIRGDLEYRQARFGTALDRYREAVSMDSMLIFAALKGAQAASWSERPELAGELAKHAEANDTILPERYRHFARGLRAYLDGSADTAAAEFRSALAIDPEWSEAWMALGEVYEHLFPSDLRVGVSAPEAFERAAGADPGFSPPLVHLAEYAIRSGEDDRAEDLVLRLRNSGAEGAAGLAATALVMACAGSKPDSAVWRGAAERDAIVALLAAHQLAVGARFPDCAEMGFRMALEQPDLRRNWRWFAVMGLQSVLVARGRDDQAAALIDETTANIPSALYLPPLDVLAGAAMQDGAERTDSIANALYGPGYERAGAGTAWVVGSWKAHTGDRGTLSAIRSRLRVQAADPANGQAGLTAAAVEARWLLMSADTAGAVEQLRSLRVLGTRSELLTSLYNAFPAERLLLAELLLARGDDDGAYWAAAALDHAQPLLFAAFVPRSLALRHRAASNLPGSVWRRRAEEARRRLEALGRADLLSPPGQP